LDCAVSGVAIVLGNLRDRAVCRAGHRRLNLQAGWVRACRPKNGNGSVTDNAAGKVSRVATIVLASVKVYVFHGCTLSLPAVRSRAFAGFALGLA
jgi:hypothetical protein